MLIRNAELYGLGRGDLLIRGDRIAAVGNIHTSDDDVVMDAGGGALLPGLHDHHIHLAALAVRDASVLCGPPAVTTAEMFADALQGPGEGWLRGIGYHESIIGLPDAVALDRIVPDRPVRIQHRSGRMWLLNSAALESLLALTPAPPGLERENGRYTGRLFDEDAWLRQSLAANPPDFAKVSHELARFGVTGITDMSPSNDRRMAAHFEDQLAAGKLQQRGVLAGALELAEAPRARWQLGPAKLHLHESLLPEFDQAVRFATEAHRQDRAVAIHCTTEVELTFALATLAEAGGVDGDRIEHASVASEVLIDQVAHAGLAVVSQPHFVAERGDQYLEDVEPRHRDELYRLRSFLETGVTLAAGSDAPFGSANPWASMAAAVYRRTASGQPVGEEEALTPDEALALYLADPVCLERTRTLEVGAPADLCLLNAPWSEVSVELSADHVRATIVGGRLVHDRVDQSPVQRRPGRDPAA